MNFDASKFTALLSAFALLLLVGLLVSSFTLFKVVKLQPQTVVQTKFVVVTPTLEPTATPAAQLKRLPFVQQKSVVK